MLKHETQIEIGVCAAAVQLQGSPKTGVGLVELPQCHQGQTKVDVVAGLIRVCGNDLANQLRGSMECPL